MTISSPSSRRCSPLLAAALDEQDTDRLVAEHQRRSSRRLSLVALAAAAVSLPFVGTVAVAIDATLGLRLLVLTAAIAAIEAFAFRQLTRGRHPRWLDVATTVAESAVPTGILLLDAGRVGAAYALTSAPSSALFVLAVLLSAMRLRPWLSLVSALLSAVGLLGSYAWLRDTIPAELLLQVPSLGWSAMLQRTAYIMLGGVGGYWIGTSLLALIRDLARTSRQQLEVRMVLGRQVSDAVAEEILSGRASVGQKRRVTMLFCDIRSYTRFSESRDPADVVAFLNIYLAAMVEVIHRHGGMVNKFLGDGLMALFGAPSDDPAQAEHAARAALEMQTVVARTRASWGVGELQIGVGIHTGEAVVGVIGSRERSEYTAIGDAVNLAARIESLNKRLGTRILVSAETRALLSGELELRALGEFTVAGRERPVELFELVPPEVSAARARPSESARA